MLSGENTEYKGYTRLTEQHNQAKKDQKEEEVASKKSLPNVQLYPKKNQKISYEEIQRVKVDAMNYRKKVPKAVTANEFAEVFEKFESKDVVPHVKSVLLTGY